MKRGLIVFTVALAIVILLSPWSGPGTPQAASPTAATPKVVKPETGGIWKILVSRSPVRFGYPPTIVGADRDYSPPFFNFLLSIGDDGKYKPELALSWDTSADGKAITFKLRQGVTFHDGTPFNAQAVKSNLDKLIPPNPAILAGVTSVDVVDNYTVKVNLTDYNNLILYQFASNYACCMYSPTTLQKNGADWAATHPVGTGPFMLKAFQPNTSMSLVKNPNYWEKGLPYLDGIDILTVPDPMTQMMMFKSGQAHAIYDVKISTASQLRKEGYPLETALGAFLSLSFDARNSEYFSKPQVRQAIEYAIDKEAIADGPGEGAYTPVYQIVSSASPDYNPTCPPRKYDPEKAKKLLAEAGYPKGFSFKAYLLDTMWPDGCVAIQSYLDKVGIKMEINYVNAAAYNTIRAGGKIEKGAAASANMPTYANNLFMMDAYFRSGAPFFQYMVRPDGVDSLIDKAKSTRDLAAVTKMNQQISKLFYDDATLVPWFHSSRIVVVDKSVQDTGWFIAGDSNNNKFGTRTWIRK